MSYLNSRNNDNNINNRSNDKKASNGGNNNVPHSRGLNYLFNDADSNHSQVNEMDFQEMEKRREQLLNGTLDVPGVKHLPKMQSNSNNGSNNNNNNGNNSNGNENKSNGVSPPRSTIAVE